MGEDGDGGGSEKRGIRDEQAERCRRGEKREGTREETEDDSVRHVRTVSVGQDEQRDRKAGRNGRRHGRLKNPRASSVYC